MGLKDADAYCARGEAFLYSGKTMRAIADYAEAIRLEPRHAEAFILRGNAWYYKNEYDKAIADYTEAIRLDPKNDQFFCWRGSVGLEETVRQGDPRLRRSHPPRSGQRGSLSEPRHCAR